MPVNRIITSRLPVVWGNLPMPIKATPRWQKQVTARFTEIRLLFSIRLPVKVRIIGLADKAVNVTGMMAQVTRTEQHRGVPYTGLVEYGS